MTHPRLFCLAPFLRNHTNTLLLFAAGGLIYLLYCRLAWLASGGEVWWHISIIGGLAVLWGDDSYRYFEALSGFPNTEVLWFNFILPVARGLDWLVTTIAQGDLLLSRYIKALVAAASSVLTFCACGRIGADRASSVVAVSLLALHPLYIFVGMSFYGEAWLTLLVALALFFTARGQVLYTAATMSLMPLVRPEGIFLLLVFAAQQLLLRNWKAGLLPFVPGFLYFLSIVLGPGLEVFVGWRLVLTEIYQTSGGWFGEGADRIFKVFYWPWLLMGFIGLCLPLSRYILAISIGASVYIFYVVTISLVLNNASFEPRYLAPCLPVLALGFSVFLSRAIKVMGRYNVRGLRTLILSVFFLFCMQAQLRANLGVERVVNHYLETGRLPVEVRRDPFSMGSWFHGISAWGVSKNREAADVVTRMVNVNHDIKMLVIGSIHIFYHLKPDELRDGVRVVFLAVPAERLLEKLGEGKLAGYFSTPPYGNHFYIRAAEPETEQILLVDQIDLPGYPLHWRVGHNDIFLFSEGTGNAMYSD